MIYLYSRNNAKSSYGGKVIIKDKTITAEILNNQTNKTLVATKDLSEEKYNTFLLMINEEKIDFIEAFRYSSGYREDLSHLEPMFNMTMLAIIKIGKMNKSESDFDLSIELARISRSNLEIETTHSVTEQSSDTDEDGKFSKHIRRALFTSYSLTINDTEYLSDENGVSIKERSQNIIEYDKDYIDIKIKKYDSEFNDPQIADDDNEKVYIESTCGLLNATMIQLKNGEGAIRLYPFDYEGIFTIKVGWRWYRVRNQYDLMIKKANPIESEE